MGRKLLCLFCALFFVACSNDDEPSGYIKLEVDGVPATIRKPQSMSDAPYFDYYYNFGIGYGGLWNGHSLYFMHASGQETIQSLEYFATNSWYYWEQHELAYLPASGFQSDIELETDRFIQGSFSGEFVNQEGDSKQVSGRFKIYK